MLLDLKYMSFCHHVLFWRASMYPRALFLLTNSSAQINGDIFGYLRRMCMTLQWLRDQRFDSDTQIEANTKIAL